MKHISTKFVVALFGGVLFACFISLFYAESIHESTRNHLESHNQITIANPQHIFRAGDTVHCEDGSTYRIQDVIQYQQPPANLALAGLLVDAFSASVPRADAIHFTDISGDYLFVKNRYEMYRMLYTLSQSAIAEAEDVLLSIPDDAIPMVLDFWNPEWLLEFQRSHSNKISCLESWDMYKDGSYLRTVYLPRQFKSQHRQINRKAASRMKCLLRYKWVKLPRNLLPPDKGIMGSWARLASRAAFRCGQAVTAAISITFPPANGLAVSLA